MSLTAILGTVLTISQLPSIMNLFPPLQIKYQKWSLDKYPVNLPTIQEAVDMYYRGDISLGDYIQLARYNGFDNKYASLYLNKAETLTPAMDLITLYRRKEITLDELRIKAKEIHVEEDTLNKLLKVSEVYPNAPDLIRFAVREVYSPEISSKYGMFEDYPEKFTEEAAKLGLGREHASQYWAAHWELPSTTQAFEMFHRRVINEDELAVLLRAKDVMPYWRDKLTKISYNPITRVDVRRLYRTGVYTRNQVYESYLDVGYSPEHAEYLTEFTVLDAINEETTTTRSILDEAYMKDLISLQTYKEGLAELGYTDKPIAIYTSIVQYDKKMKDIETVVKELKARYRQGIISLDEISNKLLSYDLPASYIERTISDIKLSISEKVKTPTKDDFLSMYTKGTISKAYYTKRMLQLGYSEEDVSLYVASKEGIKDFI
jgi:predicted DNA-binding transcriptional regulator